MSKRPRSLFEEILELAVYVPAGIASKVLEQVPELAEAGRRRVGGQIDQARVIGRFAVNLARSRTRRPAAPGARRGTRPTAEHPAPEPPTSTRRGSAPSTARVHPEGPGAPTSTHAPAPERPAAPPRAGSGPSRGQGEPPSARRGRATAGGPGRRTDETLERPEPPQAIPDYDALAASQVVPRLQGLDREELVAVERYEAATRGRRTILNRVAQLQRALDAD